MDLEQAPLFHNVILQVRETNGDALAGPEWAETSGMSVEDPCVTHCWGDVANLQRVGVRAHTGELAGFYAAIKNSHPGKKLQSCMLPTPAGRQSPAINNTRVKVCHQSICAPAHHQGACKLPGDASTFLFISQYAFFQVMF